jgi:predicted nucleic acid-binding protein
LDKRGQGQVAEVARFVVDASVVVKWVLPGEPGMGNAVRLKDDHVSGAVELHAPSLIIFEVANTLWKAARLRRLKPGEAEDALKALDGMRVILHEVAWERVADAVGLASDLDITVYDSSYVSLAEELNTCLITADRELAEKAAGRVKSLYITEY